MLEDRSSRPAQAALGETRQARTAAGSAVEPGLARDLSELARELEAAVDLQSVMDRVVAAAAEQIDGAVGAAITLVVKGEVSSPAHSDDRARLVGAIQSETGEGPCVDTSREQVTLRSDDLRTEARWPEFARRAVELGVQSVMSFQLFVEADSIGALDVYGGAVGGFDAESETVGLLLASHAAIAMAGSRQAGQLRAGLDTRDMIGQAKGILMERFKITGPMAFDLLVLASQNTNRKLRDVADELVSTGQLNGPV